MTKSLLRLIGWNTAFVVAGLVLVVVGGEVYFRLTTPFMAPTVAFHFVPNVGLIWKPDTEVRSTNRLDYWTVSRTNSLGFLDREPVGPERRAAGCHIAMIGDSLVEARQVAISDKFHVRLEKLAARELPDLRITTSAFGIGGYGQIMQLPFYDEFARALRPKLVVLVFVNNDFRDNIGVLRALSWGLASDSFPFVSAERSSDGAMTLRPPSKEHWMQAQKSRPLPGQQTTGIARVAVEAAKTSYFLNWLYKKRLVLRFADPKPFPWAEIPGELRPLFLLHDGSRPRTFADIAEAFDKRSSSPVVAYALELTAFALDQFKKRTDRDGASLVILATHRIGTRGSLLFDRMNALAEARRIPVIDQYGYILRHGHRVEDAHWPHDNHWSLTGHRWAAEALLEFLKRRPETCDGAAPRTMR